MLFRSEEVVAIDLAAIHRVALVPFEYHTVGTEEALAGSVFRELDAEMSMVPVGIMRVVHLSVASFRSDARGVATRTQTYRVTLIGDTVFGVGPTRRNINAIVRILVEVLQIPVPVLLGDGDGYLRHFAKVVVVVGVAVLVGSTRVNRVGCHGVYDDGAVPSLRVSGVFRIDDNDVASHECQ